MMILPLVMVLGTFAALAPGGRQEGGREPAAVPVPPYVVIPEGRPWEAPAIGRTPLRYEIAKADPDAGRRSYTAGEAGLVRLERGSALVFHSPGRKKLAEQVAELVERQHRLLSWYTGGQPFQGLPIVVVGAEEQLPKPMGFWVVIDGNSCWKLITSETTLPLREDGNFWADAGRSWLYHGTIHECCHHGTCYKLGLMPHRWFCEGLSDYIGALAAVCYSGEGDKAHVSQWLEPVQDALKQRETIDILSPEVWWAPGGGRLEEPIELAAYGASLYSMARLIDEQGHEWIARTLKRIEAAPGPDQATLIAIIEEEAGVQDLEARLRAVPLRQTLQYLKQGMPPEGRPEVRRGE